MEIYAVSIVTFSIAHYAYRYYRGVLKQKYTKVASPISYIFEVRHKHYPQVTVKALHHRKTRGQTCRQIDEYSHLTFEVLEKVVWQLPSARENPEPPPAKLMLIRLVLSVFWVLPMLYQFASRHIDYKETIRDVRFKPGVNTIDNVSFVLDSQNRVLRVERVKRQIIPQAIYFENFRTLMDNLSPFLSLLSLCIFFFWYEHQRKNPYVIMFKICMGALLSRVHLVHLLGFVTRSQSHF